MAHFRLLRRRRLQNKWPDRINAPTYPEQRVLLYVALYATEHRVFDHHEELCNSTLSHHYSRGVIYHPSFHVVVDGQNEAQSSEVQLTVAIIPAGQEKSPSTFSPQNIFTTNLLSCLCKTKLHRQALTAHICGMAYSMVTRFEAPEKKKAPVNVDTNSEEGETALTRAGTAFLAMLPWKNKRKGSGDSECINGKEEKEGRNNSGNGDVDDDYENGRREDFSIIIQVKPSGGTNVSDRKQSHFPLLIAKKSRVIPTVGGF